MARGRMLARAAVAVLLWAVAAVPAFLLLFLTDEAPVVVASHDAKVRPTLSSYHRVDLGPYLPDFRVRHDDVVGVDVVLGKTNATTPEELVRRYATLASRPEPEMRRLRSEVAGLAIESGLRAAVIGVLPVAGWLLLGGRRRRELVIETPYAGLAVFLVAGAVVVALVQPWREPETQVRPARWIPLQTAVPQVPVPAELAGVEVQSGLLTATTRKFVTSGFDSYAKSKVFYDRLQERAGEVAPLLHEPAEDETVAVLVSDRHDNISMDAVVREVADLAGATVVLDAGDDTSTGEPWEAFSLDSLDEAFEDYDEKVVVAGNHDHGDFVARYLRDLGWTHLDGEPEEVADVRFLGVDDPRSSGLGSWREETGLTFAEVRERVAEDACRLEEDGERVATLLVHDANLGRDALARGCVDLVLGGHLHRQVGPTQVIGSNGSIGYSYTQGTTGGAAYAIAIGSKPRRDAQFTFVTYSDGRPVGLQPVTITPGGEYQVAPYTELDLDPRPTTQGPTPLPDPE